MLFRSISAAAGAAGVSRDLAAEVEATRVAWVFAREGGEGDKARAAVDVSALGEAEWEWVEPNPLKGWSTSQFRGSLVIVHFCTYKINQNKRKENEISAKNN